MLASNLSSQPGGHARAYRLTRNFAISALLISSVAATTLVYFARNMTVDQLNRVAERYNADLTQAIANSVWHRHAEFIDTIRSLSADEIRSHSQTKSLAARVADLVPGTRVLKVKLYDLSGLTAFSTEPTQIGADSSTNERYLTAKAGRIASKLEFRKSFNAVDGTVTDRWVISSYVPVRPSASGFNIEGVAEIYTDVSDIRAEAVRFERRLTAIVVTAFVLVFGFLVLLVRRADQQITAHHEQSLKMAASVAKSEAASRSKSDFLANMSHELRTPLNAIIGFSEIMREQSLGPMGSARYLEYASDIHASGSHLRDIINVVLDLVKVESGKMDVADGEVDPAELCRMVHRLQEPAADTAGITLKLDIAADLRPLRSDTAKIRQILLNLVSNAIKFTEPGGQVEITLRRNPNTQITVSDTGIGMQPEDIPVALAPFSQIDSTLARRQEGTGLGLHLSRKFAQLLGGDLEISSKPGEGTSVTLTLPDPHPAPRAA